MLSITYGRICATPYSASVKKPPYVKWVWKSNLKTGARLNVIDY